MGEFGGTATTNSVVILKQPAQSIADERCYYGQSAAGDTPGTTAARAAEYSSQSESKQPNPSSGRAARSTAIHAVSPSFSAVAANVHIQSMERADLDDFPKSESRSLGCANDESDSALSRRYPRLAVSRNRRRRPLSSAAAHRTRPLSLDQRVTFGR